MMKVPKRWFSYRTRLPDEALDQLNAILTTYDRLKATHPPANAGDDQLVQTLREKLKDHPEDVSWTDIAQAELCVIDVLDHAQLAERLESWRRRMAEVAGPARYALYLASACDPADPKTTDDQLRADLSECIRAVYYFYGAYGIAARCRSDITKSLFRVASVIILIEAAIAIVFGWRTSPTTWLINLTSDSLHMAIVWVLATSAAAVAGSIVSVQRRLQDPKADVDPMYRYIQTTGDWFSTAFVSPVFAAIFGVVMYALLASQLLGYKLITINKNWTPDGGVNEAVLIILGFVAGFAEQLIPDALTRIAARALGTVSEGPPVPPVPQPTQTTQTTQPKTQIQSQPQAQRLPLAPPLTPQAAALGQDPSLASQPNVVEQPAGEAQDAGG